jgi:4'-phosphopantetheinyl transferase
VHVWRARLDLVRDRIGEMWRVLSAEERTRVERLRVPADRERAIVARGLSRMILAREVAADPSELRFTYGPQGKPALDPPAALRFNVAHSGNVVLLAVAQEHEVGIDVEGVRCDLDWAPLAARFFGPRELSGLRALAPERRDEAFFACWTRKEAYLKATGLGLAVALDSFGVSVDADSLAALLWVREDPGAAARWSLVDIPVEPGYRACLAAPRPGVQPICRNVTRGLLP